MKNALTAQQIAALAVGAVAASTDTEATAAALTPEAAIPAVEIIAEVNTAPVAETAPAADAGVVQLLQSQLAASQATVLQLTVEASATKAAVSVAEANLTTANHLADQMRPVVRASLGNLRVALNGSKAGVDTLNDEALIAEHTTLAAEFGQKFKAGGVAAVPAPVQAGNTGSDPKDLIRQARLDATRNRKQK